MRSVYWECGNEDLDINGGGKGLADRRGHSPNTSSSASASGVEDIFNLKKWNFQIYLTREHFYLDHIQSGGGWCFHVFFLFCFLNYHQAMTLIENNQPRSELYADTIWQLPTLWISKHLQLCFKLFWLNFRGRQASLCCLKEFTKKWNESCWSKPVWLFFFSLDHKII